MTCPLLGVCGALQLEDARPLFAEQDPLGLRGRALLLLHTRYIGGHRERVRSKQSNELRAHHAPRPDEEAKVSLRIASAEEGSRK